MTFGCVAGHRALQKAKLDGEMVAAARNAAMQAILENRLELEQAAVAKIQLDVVEEELEGRQADFQLLEQQQQQQANEAQKEQLR